MPFKCLDCGNKSSRKFPGGKCPACDSFNIRVTRQVQYASEDPKKRTLQESVLMVLLWVLMLYGIWDKFIA